MGDKEWAPDNVFDVFGDSIARATLILARDHPVAVKELSAELDVSDPTIYRRVDSLVDAGLLSEHCRVNQNGNQHKEYETVLDEVTFRVDSDGFSVEITARQEVTDDFESLWWTSITRPVTERSPLGSSPHRSAARRISHE